MGRGVPPLEQPAQLRGTKRNKHVPEEGEAYQTSYSKSVNVVPVVSSTYRMAVAPPVELSAMGVSSEVLQSAMAAVAKKSGESAGITQSGQMFSKMLYKPVTGGLDVDLKKSYTETFSFQVAGQLAEAMSDEPKTIKKAKIEAEAAPKIEACPM